MAKPKRIRVTRVLAAAAFACAGASGCFALFPLDEYGPGAADGSVPVGDADVDGARVDAPSDADLRYEGSIAFVTSARLTSGAVNGIANADIVCQLLAADAGIDASFKAFLGDRANDATQRLRLDGGRIVTRRGGLVAESWTELLTRGPKNAFYEDERGNAVARGGTCEDGGAVWTGAMSDGGRTSDDCSRWDENTPPGAAGLLGETSPRAISACLRPCGNPASLYCFQQ